MSYKFSDQAIGAIMMALQKSLMEQSDIVPMFQNFEVQVDDSDHLVIMNPPVVKTSKTKSPGTSVSEGESIETSVQ